MGPEERENIAARVREVAGAPRAQEDGPPVGYPEAFPLIPGYAVFSGAVDPGVVRTATLTYELDADDLADALLASAGPAGFALVERDISPTGTVRLRFEREGTLVSVAIRSDGARSALQVIEHTSR